MFATHHTIKRSVRFGVAAVSLALGSASHAEFRLAAFEDARGYSALSRQDVAAAASVFRKRSGLSMDYADLNNLCVVRILEGDTVKAETLCRKAYVKVVEKSMRLREKRKTRAVILANLAVAQGLEGKAGDALDSLARAERLDGQNPNVAINRYALARDQLAAGR